MIEPKMYLTRTDYAKEAIKLGSTAIGIKAKEGVVLAVEKRITSSLLEPSKVEKVMSIGEHIGCAMSGLVADARTLVKHARVEMQNHKFSYGEPTMVESATQALRDLALRFGEGGEESMEMTLQKDETVVALLILKQEMEEKVTPTNIDIAKVAPTYHLYSPSEVEAIISRL